MAKLCPLVNSKPTRGWFGCCSRRDSNLSTLIGVTILKRTSWASIVEFMAILLSSEVGTKPKGGAVSVDIAGVLKGALCDQRNPPI